MNKNNSNNIINHIVLVLDASYSMTYLSGQLIKVADKQIQYLAERSKQLDQETRITVYTFSSDEGSRVPKIECLVYDKDVLRMPSISGLYHPGGNTPLIDATLLALEDLALTPEKYGQHSFLVYVLTDGQENISRGTASQLSRMINDLPDNWTLATFVPDQTGVFEAKQFGFPKENIAIWDTTSNAGVQEMGERIRQTTETFMQNRSRGIRGSRNLFTVETPSAKTVQDALNYLNYSQFSIFNVRKDDRIDKFVEDMTGRPYKLGEGYYQLTKPETIQPQKHVAILLDGKVYVGKYARDLLGLPDYHIRVQPSDYNDYDIFVQSTSVNRKLKAGTKLLVIN